MLGVEFELSERFSQREVSVRGEGLHSTREEGAGAFGGTESGEEEGGVVVPNGRDLGKLFDGG